MKEPRGILWVPVPAQFTEEAVYLPHFLSGEDWEALTQSGVHLHARDLLFGILLGYATNPLSLQIETIRPHLVRQLSFLAAGFHEPSVETLVLNAAAHLREKFDSRASARALRNALEFLPTNSRIRSDLICDLSNVGEWTNEMGRVLLAGEILRTSDVIQMHKLMPGAPIHVENAIARARAILAGVQVPPPPLNPAFEEVFPLATSVKFPDRG